MGTKPRCEGVAFHKCENQNDLKNYFCLFFFLCFFSQKFTLLEDKKDAGKLQQ